MQERLKKIQARLLEFWNKYNKKQRTIFLSIVGGVIVLLVVMIIILSRTVYMNIAKFDDKATAANAVSTLTTNNIKARMKTDGTSYVVQVDEKQEIEATILITGTYGESEYFSLEQLLNNSLSTTNSDRRLKNDLYIRSEIEAGLKALSGISNAQVIFYPTSESTSILTNSNNKACSVILTVTQNISSKVAANLAQIISSALGNVDKNGNVDTSYVKIMDQNMNLLWGETMSGEEEEMTLREQWISWMTNFIKERMIELGEKNGFDTTVGLSLMFDFSEESYTYHQYLAAEGSEQGLFSIYEKYESENKGNSGDVVGTDANDETDYYITNGGNGASSESSTKITYTPSEKLTSFIKDASQVLHDKSTAAIVLNRVVDVTESDLQKAGALDDMTFEEYIRKNSSPVLLGDEYTEQVAAIKTVMANASTIPEANITVLAYEVYNYIPNETTEFDWSIILRILLAVLIIGLLLFVLLRGMRPEEVVEQEPELSIEQLLATTKENQTLEEIEISEKSETLRLIEKLIDENPAAVANLLRNWLEDDWG